MYTKLQDLDSNFKNLHLLVIDQIEEDEALEAEQAILDKHDDDVADLTVRIQRLTNSDSIGPIVTQERERRLLSLKISRLEKGLNETDQTISALSEGIEDLSLLQQHQEQLSDYKRSCCSL